MGKISNAIEKHKKEKEIKTKRLPIESLSGLDNNKNASLNSNHENFTAIDPKLVVYSVPESLDAENFKLLRSQILFPQNGERKRIIMITSSFPGEGKTFVAANLAASIAMGINEYVLLIDCDFRRPNLHKMLGYSNSEGLHEYLESKKDLHELIINTRIDKLSLLSSGRPTRKPAELLGSIEMREFLEEVKDRYQDRYIVIDAPPFQVTSEAGVLSHYVDGVVFVVKSGNTPKELIKKSVEKIGKKKIIGVVFNGFNQKQSRYGKYYKGYY